MSLDLDKVIEKLEEVSRLLQQSRDCLHEVIQAFETLEKERIKKQEQVTP